MNGSFGLWQKNQHGNSVSPTRALAVLPLSRAGSAIGSQIALAIRRQIQVGIGLLIGAAAVSPTRSHSEDQLSKSYCSAGREIMAQLQHIHYGAKSEAEWKPLPGCPGADDVDPGYANLSVSGVKFRVPRNYLQPPQGQEADGPAQGIRLLMRAMPLQPLPDNSKSKTPEDIRILILGKAAPCRDAECSLILSRRAMRAELASSVVGGLDFPEILEGAQTNRPTWDKALHDAVRKILPRWRDRPTEKLGNL